MELAVHRPIGPLQVFSPCLREFLLTYGVGVVAALQILAITEFLVSLPLEWVEPAVAVVFGAPVLLALVAARVRGRRPGRLRLSCWLPNMLVMLVLAGCGYFVVAMLARSDTYWALDLGVDRAIPEVPAWVFFYLTVYFVYSIPLVYLQDIRQLAKLDVAQAATLLLCYVVFVLFPVATERVHVPIVDLATFALATVREFDPPWNCFPSTHCTTCTVASLAVFQASRRMGGWLLVTTLLICLSTLLTKQHFLVDVVAGVMVGGTVWWLVDRSAEKGRLVNAVAGLLARLNGEGGRA